MRKFTIEALNVCSGAHRHTVTTVTTAPNHIPQPNLIQALLRDCTPIVYQCFMKSTAKSFATHWWLLTTKRQLSTFIAWRIILI